MRSTTLLLLGFSLLVASGCGDNATPMGEKKETTGRLTLNGKPLADVKVVLQPMGDGADAHGVTDKGGTFKTQATPGKYTWYVLPKDEKKSSEGALKAVPEAFKTGSMDRSVQTGAGELNLEVK